MKYLLKYEDLTGDFYGSSLRKKTFSSSSDAEALEKVWCFINGIDSTEWDREKFLKEYGEEVSISKKDLKYFFLDRLAELEEVYREPYFLQNLDTRRVLIDEEVEEEEE